MHEIEGHNTGTVNKDSLQLTLHTIPASRTMMHRTNTKCK